MRIPYKYVLPAFVTVVDAGLTLHGQPAAYWHDYSKCNEMFPAFAAMLKIHPAVFLAAVLGWIMAYCLLIRILPQRLSLIVAISFMTGHFFGALTWILYHHHAPFYATLLLFPVFAWTVVFLAQRNGRSS